MFFLPFRDMRVRYKLFDRPNMHYVQMFDLRGAKFLSSNSFCNDFADVSRIHRRQNDIPIPPPPSTPESFMLYLPYLIFYR